MKKLMVGVYYMYFYTHAGTLGEEGGGLRWAFNTYSMGYVSNSNIR